MFGLFQTTVQNGGLCHGKGCITSFKSWSQVDILGNDTTIKKTKHTILNVILSDWWWVCEGVVTELFGKNSLGATCFFILTLADTQLF
jgi:hypothetical protein